MKLSSFKIGPHRNLNPATIEITNLLHHPIEYTNTLKADHTNRTPNRHDPASDILKRALCGIEILRRNAITALVARYGEATKDKIRDPWEPLKVLTSMLLPHLSFKGVFTEQPGNIQCLWSDHSRDGEPGIGAPVIDLNDLSSGEKSVIQLLYPFIEHKAKSLTREMESGSLPGEQEGDCVVIDEPELHLHPNLQRKVFDYLRYLAESENLQVIIATHSPTIVEHATGEELYLLKPRDMVEDDENQLVQVSPDDEKLQFLKDVFGTTYNLTALQPIVVVEGDENSRSAPDVELYQALYPKFNKVTLIAGGGKSECIRMVKNLNTYLDSSPFPLKAVALLDRDIKESDYEDEDILLLPVSMIENVFIDPDVLWGAIESDRSLTAFESSGDIVTALDELISLQEEHEVERRIKVHYQTEIFRPSSPLDEVQSQIDNFTSKLREKYTRAQFEEVKMDAIERVEKIKATSQEKVYYDGKKLLKEFFKKHLHSTTISTRVLLHGAAKQACQKKNQKEFFDSFFEKLGT